MKSCCLLLLLYFFFVPLFSNAAGKDLLLFDNRDTCKTNAMPEFVCIQDSFPVFKKSNKLMAAVLSFPVPFGILGLHRVYLGTKPYVPFFYIGTLGGCLGILPLIDFICIISSGRNELQQYENCPGVFMWLVKS
jgi:hypothetical protein